MICLVNSKKLIRFSKRSVMHPTEINLLSTENLDVTVGLVIAMFLRRGGMYHIRFWVGGSFTSKGHLVRECKIEKNGVVTYLDE